MSKESFAAGFVKAAMARGVNPEALAKLAAISESNFPQSRTGFDVLADKAAKKVGDVAKSPFRGIRAIGHALKNLVGNGRSAIAASPRPLHTIPPSPQTIRNTDRLMQIRDYLKGTRPKGFVPAARPAAPYSTWNDAAARAMDSMPGIKAKREIMESR